MENFGKIILIAIPAFLLLILIEKWYGWRKGFDTIRNLDMISSLSSGITNITKDILGLSIAIVSYEWMLDRFAVTHVDSGFLTYFIAFIALDFSGYWGHRINHEYNLFWNNHVVHHSSEEFNLACALRQSISVFFRIFTFFLLPAALLGVPGKVIAIVAPLHLFAQFWYHTRHIGRMGFLEKIIVTPSHHRVHHAINPIYLDKNYGQIFIFWDKLFGTYQEERDDTPPVYGITRPVQTWNPIKINFKHLFLLIRDAWHTRSWRDKLRIWFMPTGWRPDDVAERFPVRKIDDIYNFEKYDTPADNAMHAWCWFQMLAMLAFISWFFSHVASIGSPGIFYYGAFIFLYVYALTDLMDGNASSVYWELVKLLFCAFLLWQQAGDWFGARAGYPVIPYLVAGYLLVSIAGTVYFANRHNRKEQPKMSIA
jgi:sterol desaturase/sphingolipid hydroxylase (fatty acid hydroxylase superfamily)